jgi:uncharacterized protein
MVLMEVSGVYTSSKSAYPQVVLKEKGGDLCLPIVIGRFEAAAISMAQNERKPTRPLSYDLAHSVLELVDARIEKVEITDLHEGTYYAEVYLREENGATTVLDSRPSDAIALALRMGAPIYAAAAVLKEAGYVRPPDESQETAPPAPPPPELEPVEPELKSNALESATAELPESEPADQLEALRRRLRQAIAEEVYEEAARLRDEINRLEADANN